MRRWLTFFLALLVWAIVHEGAHALVAYHYGEFEGFYVRPFGLEVVFETPVEERSGLRWAFISGGANLLTILLGYLLAVYAGRLAIVSCAWLRGSAYYLTLLCLLLDPLNLSIGPFLYGGDANGIAVGLDTSRHLIQAVSFLLLFANRELASHLLPTYGIVSRNPLLKPWFRR